MHSFPDSARPIRAIAPVAFAVLMALLAACQGAATSLTITAPQSGSSTVGETVTVRGTAPANAEVVHYLIYDPVDRTIADASGNWSLEIRLNEGPNQLLFRLGDDESTAKRLQVTRSPRTTPTFATPSSYVQYLGQVSSTLRTLGEHVQRIGELGSENDPRGLQGEAESALMTAQSALEWLDQNPADLCYSELQESWREVLGGYSEAFETIQGALTPPVDNSELKRGSDLLTEAVELASTAMYADAGACP